MKVLKFGGSSVKTPEKIRKIAEIIKDLPNKDLAIVFSAFGGITDQLIQAGKEASEGNKEYLKTLSKIQNRHISFNTKMMRFAFIEKLEPILKKRGYKGIHDVAKWLGQPYDPQFKKNQKKYIDLENQTMEEIMENAKNPKKNIVIDTTGSVIYTNEENLKRLKRHSIVIYIEASPEMKKEMLDQYLAHPKPVVWGESFQKLDGESDKQALARCYEQLLDFRSKLYEKQADLVILYYQVNAEKIDEDQFLSLIENKL